MRNLTRAAEMAYRCLLRLHIDVLPVQPSALLQLCRGTKLYTYDEARAMLSKERREDFEQQCQNVDALTIRGDMSDGSTRYLVCYNEGGNRARMRFTLAHELGHIVLKHASESADEKAEADCFASHLLCPRPLLARMQAENGPMPAEQIARIFYVTEVAAEHIMHETPEPVSEQLSEQVAQMYAKWPER